MSGNDTSPCDSTLDADSDVGRNIVPSENEAMLSDKKLINYQDYKERFLQWHLPIGKNPDPGVGYSP